MRWPGLVLIGLAFGSSALLGELAGLPQTSRRRRQPTGENEPPPHQRLPPRETRTELRRTTRRAPELHRQTNAMEIERSNPALPPLPTNADQGLPTPSGPATL